MVIIPLKQREVIFLKASQDATKVNFTQTNTDDGIVTKDDSFTINARQLKELLACKRFYPDTV